MTGILDQHLQQEAELKIVSLNFSYLRSAAKLRRLLEV